MAATTMKVSEFIGQLVEAVGKYGGDHLVCFVHNNDEGTMNYDLMAIGGGTPVENSPPYIEVHLQENMGKRVR